MIVFNLSDVIGASERSQQRWHEFLRVSTLSMGIYHLHVGDADEQKPHAEDEVYLVISGKASLRAGSQVQAVAAGSLIFVDKCVEHRFIDIAEDLTVLVFFAPPEGSCATAVSAVSE